MNNTSPKQMHVCETTVKRGNFETEINTEHFWQMKTELAKFNLSNL